MLHPVVIEVFENAALPQRLTLLLLLATMPMILVAALLAVRGGARAVLWRHFIAEMRIAGPALALLVAGLHSFHMGETIRGLPFDPTLKQLAPGIFEVSAFVALGAAVGLSAVAAHLVVSWMRNKQRTS